MNNESGSTRPPEPSPVELACRWFGHVPGTEYPDSRTTTTEEGESVEIFYIGSDCRRCGQTDETVIDRDEFLALLQYGWKRYLQEKAYFSIRRPVDGGLS